MAVTTGLLEDERDFIVSLTRKESTGTRGFWFPWAQRVAIAFNFLGGHQADGFHAPRRHPDYSGMCAMKVEQRPITPDKVSGASFHEQSVVQSELGKMIVEYRNDTTCKEDASSSSSSTDFLGEVTMEYSAEMLTLKSSRWRWQQGDKEGKDLNDGEITPFKLIPLKTVVLTLNEQQLIETDELDCSVGKINKTEWAGHACGTLLLLGARTERVITPTGIEFETGEVRFAFKKTGWNRFWDGKQFSLIGNVDVSEEIVSCGFTVDGAHTYDLFEIRDIVKKIEVLE